MNILDRETLINVLQKVARNIERKEYCEEEHDHIVMELEIAWVLKDLAKELKKLGKLESL